MPSARQGSIHLFRFADIDVFLHWSWFVVAVFEINARAGKYSSITWNVLEYLALFLIVLLHEFGHALACRQVGGRANRIVLWPLGGVAFVDPPPRPGTVEHRGGTTGERGAGSDLIGARHVEPSRGVGAGDAQCPRTAAGGPVHQRGLADVQPVARLPAGRRPDRSVSALVCSGTRPQFAGSHPDRLRRRGAVGGARLPDWVRLVWCSLGIHPAELLGRTKTVGNVAALGEVTASRRVCLSMVQSRATSGKLLDVRRV